MFKNKLENISYVRYTSYVSYMSYAEYISYINYMSYVGYMNYMSYVSYMSFFMNRIKSLETTRICFKYNIFCFQKFCLKFS